MAKKKRTMTEGSKFAIATNVCKDKGHTSFKEGSAGAACRKRVTHGIKKKTKIVKGPARGRRR